MQGLREDDAIEPPVRQGVRLAQIGNDRGTRVGGIDVEDVASLHSITTEAVRVVCVHHFEARASDVALVDAKELFDVHPVDGRAAIVAPVPAERVRTPEISPLDRTRWPFVLG
jgi:hypothetical protein